MQTEHRRDTLPNSRFGHLGLMVASVTTVGPHKAGPAVLSLDIQQHLCARLAAVYSQGDARPPPAHFADLLARLDAALAEAKGSDERAFRAGLLKATSSLFSFAMSLSRNPTAADDLVQETMMRAWRSRHSYQAETNLGAWLFTIMRNVFYSVHRKKAHEVPDSDGDYAARLTSLPEQGGHLDLQDVQLAIGQLAPPMREALVLIAIENVSIEDAARIMNCRMGTVKSRVWRARQQLAAILGYTGGDVGADGALLSALSVSDRVAEA